MLTNLEREGDHRHVTWKVIQEEHMAGNIKLVSQVSGSATGLKQSFSLSNVVFGKMWRAKKNWWEDQDSEEWYPSFGSRATDWCFDVHNSPAYFYSVIRAFVTVVQCANVKTHSKASLCLTDVYLREIKSKVQVSWFSSERKQELSQMTTSVTCVAPLSSLLGKKKVIEMCG